MFSFTCDLNLWAEPGDLDGEIQQFDVSTTAILSCKLHKVSVHLTVYKVESKEITNSQSRVRDGTEHVAEWFLTSVSWGSVQRFRARIVSARKSGLRHIQSMIRRRI